MAAAKDNDQFAGFAGAVGKELLGDPNKALSSQKELRWGDRGSMSLDLDKGTFFDHKANLGGGVLWLVERETGKTAKGGHAVEWLREAGFHVEDNSGYQRPAPSSGGGQGANGREYKPPRFDKAGNRLPDRVPDHAQLTKAHDYRDAAGELVYQVVRYDWDDPEHPKGHDKTFVQRRPDASKKDGWTFSVKGIDPLPYRLPELLEDIAAGEEIFLVEGEKKADMLRDIGVPATCNSGGGGKFPEVLVQWFKGAKVTILGDNDEVGAKHVKLVAGRLEGTAARVRALDLPGLPEHGGVDDWLPAGGTAERLYELAAELGKGVEVEPFHSKFGAVSWFDMDAPGLAYEHLVKGVLTRGEMSMTAGESMSGKTFLVTDISMCVARGVPFFGHRVRRGGVAYQVGEGARGMRRKRLKAYRQHFDCASENIPFVLLENAIDLYTSDDQTDALIEELRHWARVFEQQHGVPLELVVIDTWSKATPGINENDSADVGRVLERCDRIRRATGAHVMLVHHMNAEGAKPRGHTSMLANIETVIITRKLDDHHDADNHVIREWELKKQKEGEAGGKTKFVLPVVQIGTDEDGDPITSCIVALPSGEAGTINRATDDGVTLGGVNATVLRALYEALASAEGVFAPAELNLPQGTLVASRKAHGGRFAAISSPDDFDSLTDEDKKKLGDTLRQQLKRARDFLYSKGILGMNNEWVWLTGKRVKGFGPPPGTAPRRERKKKEEGAEEAPKNLPFADEDFDPRDM